jgi:hypothetical protein
MQNNVSGRYRDARMAKSKRKGMIRSKPTNGYQEVWSKAASEGGAPHVTLVKGQREVAHNGIEPLSKSPQKTNKTQKITASHILSPHSYTPENFTGLSWW